MSSRNYISQDAEILYYKIFFNVKSNITVIFIYLKSKIASRVFQMVFLFIVLVQTDFDSLQSIHEPKFLKTQN